MCRKEYDGEEKENETVFKYTGGNCLYAFWL